MDKDDIILKYEQETVCDIDSDTQKLKNNNDEQEMQLQRIQERLFQLDKSDGKKPSVFLPNIRRKKLIENEIECESCYDDLYVVAQQSLSERGLDTDDIDYHDLVSEKELESIIKDLNTPLPRDEKWDKSDFIVTFIAAFIGCAYDVVFSNRNNKFAGEDSKFSERLNELHEKTFKHKSGAPIDYQGKGFGGGYHRGLSKGHDLARFIDGMKMFKDGTFEGVRYIDGVPQKVISSVNQNGNDFAKLTTIEAIIGYACHMFADVFSIYSLPFPGYSFLAESSNRNFRLFAADMYKNGFNLKNVMTQSISVIIIEVIIRLYYSIQSVMQYYEKIEIDEDYSNVDAIKEFINPKHKEKLNEMLLVAHAIVTAENAGKISIKCLATKNIACLSEINIAEIIAVVRYGISVVNAVAARNNEYAKLIYHTDEINSKWSELEDSIMADEIIAITANPQYLVV